MAGFARRELLNHQPRSASTIHGTPSILFGLPFLAMGLGVCAVAAGCFGEQDFGASPPWVVGSLGAVFALAGLYLVGHGVRGRLRGARVAARKARHPSEPWMWDHAWDPRGVGDHGHVTLLRTVNLTLFLAIFLVPFNWWAWYSGEGPIPVKVIVGIFDAAAIYAAGHAVLLCLRRLRFGAARLEFGHFPFHFGEPLDVRFVPPRRLTGVGTLACRLRCIEERYETRGSGENSSSCVVCYERWAVSREVPLAAGAPHQPLSFTLPEGPDAKELSTRLADRPAFYWELEVTAERPGLDLVAPFLVPVYARD